MNPFAYIYSSIERKISSSLHSPRDTPAKPEIHSPEPEHIEPEVARTWNINPKDFPWFDQPNALELLENRRSAEHLSEEDYNLLHKWVSDGYCVISGVVPDESLDNMMLEIDQLWTADQVREGLDFHDLKVGPNDAPIKLTHAEVLALETTERFAARDKSNWRIHSFQEYSPSAKAIFYDAELIRLTSLIFGYPSIPEATINFMYGSAQNAHQDMAVFHVFPPNYIIGCWIACEDISPDSGPLMFYPKSHREPLFSEFKDYPQINLRTASPELTQAYTRYVEGLTRKYERQLFHAKKGDIFLWHGQLLHGGSEIKNPKLTRKSYVIHYFPPEMNVGPHVKGPFNW